MPNLNIENLEEYGLIRAVNHVIEQNIGVGFTPTIFIQIVRRGIAEGDLDIRISKLVLDVGLLEYLERTIQQNPRVITIEDLIAEKKDGFGLSSEVIRQAKARAARFNQIRNN